LAFGRWPYFRSAGERCRLNANCQVPTAMRADY
jgi:hypothetical protein